MGLKKERSKLSFGYTPTLCPITEPHYCAPTLCPIVIADGPQPPTNEVPNGQKMKRATATLLQHHTKALLSSAPRQRGIWADLTVLWMRPPVDVAPHTIRERNHNLPCPACLGSTSLPSSTIPIPLSHLFAFSCSLKTSLSKWIVLLSQSTLVVLIWTSSVPKWHYWASGVDYTSWTVVANSSSLEGVVAGEVGESEQKRFRGFWCGHGNLSGGLANEKELVALCVDVVGATHVRCFHQSFSRCLFNPFWPLLSTGCGNFPVFCVWMNLLWQDLPWFFFFFFCNLWSKITLDMQLLSFI